MNECRKRLGGPLDSNIPIHGLCDFLCGLGPGGDLLNSICDFLAPLFSVMVLASHKRKKGGDIALRKKKFYKSVQRQAGRTNTSNWRIKLARRKRFSTRMNLHGRIAEVPSTAASKGIAGTVTA